MTTIEDTTDEVKKEDQNQGGETQAVYLDYNTDGRKQYEWETKYPPKIRRLMMKEAMYIAVWFMVACTILILNYFRTFNVIFGIAPERLSFAYYLYFIASGLLGGVVFEMKCLCTVVAKGYWHKDRRLWRMLTPLVSMGTAYIIGAMVGAGLLSVENNSTNAWAIAIGFFSGYFADEAAGKMKEIALVFFGKTSAQERKNDTSDPDNTPPKDDPSEDQQ